jgi:hypothetical protein
MKARRWRLGSALLAVLSGCLACSRPGPGGSPAAEATSPEEEAENRRKQEMEASLTKAIEEFVAAMAASDASNRKDVFRDILVTDADVDAVLPQLHVIREWENLYLPMSDALAEELAGLGPIISIELTDLRTTTSRAWDKYWSVVARSARDVPIYAATITFASKKKSIGPFFPVEGRWRWFPQLEQMTDRLPADADPPADAAESN